MIITFHGNQFFKVQAGDMTIALNPPVLAKGEKASRFGADIAVSSCQAPYASGFETVTFGDKTPVRVDGPGSYEVEGIGFDGFMSKPDTEGMYHTLYSFSFDDIRALFLGAVDRKDLFPDDAIDEMGAIDIVYVCVTHPDAYALARSFSPHVIIPMGYESTDDEALQEFLKEAGAQSKEALDKLTIKRRDIESMTGEVMYFSC